MYEMWKIKSNTPGNGLYCPSSGVPSNAKVLKE